MKLVIGLLAIILMLQAYLLTQVGRLNDGQARLLKRLEGVQGSQQHVHDEVHRLEGLYVK